MAVRAKFLTLFALSALFIVSEPLQSRRLTDCSEITDTAAYECLGASARGKALLLRELNDKGRRDGSGFSELPMLAAQLNYREAIPILRSLLENAKNLPVGYTNYEGNLRILRSDLAPAAEALAAFGDVDSAPTIRRYLELLDSDNMGGSGWQTAFTALGNLGGKETVLYCRRVIAHVNANKKDRVALAQITARIAADSKSYDLITDLRTIKTDNLEEFTAFDEATVQGPRMELGDKGLRKWFRDKTLPQIKAVLDGSTDTVVFPVVQPEMYLIGLRDLEDLPLLIHFGSPASSFSGSARVAIIHILDNPQLYPPAEYAAFKQSLLAGLKKRTDPYLASIKGTGDEKEFTPSEQAGYYYILARLGDPSAVASLTAVMRAQTDPSEPVTWRSTILGMSLGIPDSSNHLNQIVDAELAGKGEMAQWKLRLDALNTAVSKFGVRDARWVKFLIDPHPSVRSAALHHLSRLRPAAACSIVPSVAVKFQDESGGTILGDALVALTVLGKDCVPNLLGLARNGKNRLAQGIAIEVLSMLESSEADPLRAQQTSDAYLEARLEAARNIAEFMKKR